MYNLKIINTPFAEG